jgi:hypothetical protein
LCCNTPPSLKHRPQSQCDQQTPLCGNCRKSNRLCTGYKRKLGYVLSQDVSFPEDAGPAPDNTSIVHQGRWRKKPANPQAQGYQDTHPLYQEAAPRLVGRLSGSAALTQQFHYLFLYYRLPKEILDSPHPREAVSRNFILQLQGTVPESSALQTSMAAFLASQVGRENGDMDLVHRSRGLYVTALDHLQAALRSPRTRLSDETLAACMTLSLYELIECPGGPQGSSYMAHMRGALMLLQMRGPEACVSPLGHSLFLGIRSQTVSISFQTFRM